MPTFARVLDDVERHAVAPVTDAALPTEAEALDAYSRAVTGVVEEVGPAVVSIARTSRRGPAGAGSGVVFTPDGYVLTNAHVAAGAHELELGFTDGTTSPAHLVGVDHATDLAVVRAAKPVARHVVFGNSSTLPPVSSSLPSATPPLRFDRLGRVVSALGRTMRAQTVRRWENHPGDVALNPG
jgi:S1-C subfamily serine protease